MLKETELKSCKRRGPKKKIITERTCNHCSFYSNDAEILKKSFVGNSCRNCYNEKQRQRSKDSYEKNKAYKKAYMKAYMRERKRHELNIKRYYCKDTTRYTDIKVKDFIETC